MIQTMTRRPADNRLEAAARAMGMDAWPGRDNPDFNRVGRPLPHDKSGWGGARDPAPSVSPDPLPPTWRPGPSARPTLEMAEGDCRFPVGDDYGADQLFCGEPRKPGQPYCRVCMMRVDPKNPSVNPKVLH